MATDLKPCYACDKRLLSAKCVYITALHLHALLAVAFASGVFAFVSTALRALVA